MWVLGWLACGAAQASDDGGARVSRALQHEVPLDRAAVRRIELDVGAGELEVHAVAGLDRVRITGTAWATDAALLDRLTLDIDCKADRVRVRTVMPEDSGDEQAGIDLQIVVPEGWSADVVDGSGDAVLVGLAAVSVEDGSGDLAVLDATGPVSVEDGSGSVRIERIAGPVAVDDGSGDLVIRQVGGPVAIDDGSGDLTVVEVSGSVAVDDGSGDIVIADVAGDLEIIDAGSGARRVERVAGRVRAPLD